MMKKIILSIFYILSLSGFSQWNTSTSINTGVAIAPKSQNSVHSVPDSNGGIIMAWDDNRNSVTTQDDIYAQRLNKSGVRKWTLYGNVICNDAAIQKNSSIIEADNGSAIIAWEDNRAGNWDIYAQKIDSSGNVLWTTNGVAVCSKTTTQKSPKIVGDNAGGAIIVWEDSLNFYWDIYAQRISTSGTLLWTSGGVSICSASNTQANPRVDIDGLGGAIFTWQDKRNNTDYDIYAQRVNSSGVAQWTTNGIVICNSINTQSNPRIEPDGSNGAIIGWIDKRNGLDNNIYVQRINSSGVAQWTANGVSVCSAANNQSALDMKYIGTSGIVMSWKDDRIAGANAIYTQLVSLSGITQLTANGIKISNALKSINPNTISDGNGGAIIAWQDSTILGWDVMSQKINSSGTTQWANGGVTVSNANDNQINISQVTDGNGGAIYAWDDHRNGLDYDIYAHHLFYDGSSTVGLNELTKDNRQTALCYPNPLSENSKIYINTSTQSQWEISIYNSVGSLLKKEIIKNQESYSLNPKDFSNGMYFYVIYIYNEKTVLTGNFISSK